MTLRSDVVELLAVAGVSDVDVDKVVADDHARTSAYLRVVSVIADAQSRARDRLVVTMILGDPDESGAKTAVVALVDAIAGKTASPAEFRRWSEELLPEIDRFRTVGCREFVRRRIRDWLFFLGVEDGRVPAPGELVGVTYWMQRLLAESSTSPAVLALVAEFAHTRKTRNIAKNRARSRELRPG